jgi:hypothetical protein
MESHIHIRVSNFRSKDHFSQWPRLLAAQQATASNCGGDARGFATPLNISEEKPKLRNIRARRETAFSPKQ